MRVRALTGTLGAEIFGLDLSVPVADAVFADLREAILRHGVVVA